MNESSRRRVERNRGVSFFVSNLGNVKHIRVFKNFIQEKIRKINSYTGKEHKKLRTGVALFNDYGRKKLSVPRLVGQYFVPGYSPELEINHKDGDPTNNTAENLEWVTHEENMHHAKCVLNIEPWCKCRNPWTPEQVEEIRERSRRLAVRCRPVRCKETGQVFYSIKEASRVTGTREAGISNCCKKRQHYLHANGYTWEFVELNDESI